MKASAPIAIPRKSPDTPKTVVMDATGIYGVVPTLEQSFARPRSSSVVRTGWEEGKPQWEQRGRSASASASASSVAGK